MAFRGGRGRGGRGGRGGFGGNYVRPEPFILFPEDVLLPDVSGVPEEKHLVQGNMKLQNYWKSSSFYLEEAGPTVSKDNEIERYSDRDKPKSQAKRQPLYDLLTLIPTNFPRELFEGSKRVQRDQRKVRWNPESGLRKLDFLEKREAKFGDADEKGEKEKKEGENEDDEEIELEDEEFSDDGDYNQNRDFDDDEDDFNMDDGIEDEATYS